MTIKKEEFLKAFNYAYKVTGDRKIALSIARLSIMKHKGLL